VRPWDRHAFAASGDNRFVVVDLPESVLRQVGVEGWIDRAVREPFFVASARAMQLAILAGSDPGLEAGSPEVERAWATLLLRAAASSPARKPPRAVERALLILEGRALGPLRIGDVARAVGLSTGHLHALFRKHVARSPLELVRERRVQAAWTMLLGSDTPIVEVALRCGFADQASLTHCMRRVRGCTPGEIRRSRSRTNPPE
jgi:AraC-like DNA-binding protein